jgi:mono/diheme cytochrome c family protein
MQPFLAGELEDKLRPWLAARMPAFPARAEWMSQGLAMQHGFPPAAPALTKPDAAMAAMGRQLSGKSGDNQAGFACVLCHGVGKAPAENVFEAQGINFMYAAERLNKEFYMRWMLKPSRIWPNTRMPQFAGDDGLTPFANVYDGDARKQFEAIWEYLKAGREIGRP